MDNLFFLTIGFIFLGALISNLTQWRKRDRVLKDIDGFHTTIEMQDSKKVWGKTAIFSNGMELHFSREVQNSSGNSINSYILYRDDIDNIRAIYRYQNELSEVNIALRKQEIANTCKPQIWIRLKRRLVVFFNTFNDAIGEALNVFLARMKGGGGGMIFNTQSDYLKKMGTTALSVVGNAYDPILERYVNQRVVVRLNDGKDEEFCGFLKEYSSAWISVLDCELSQTTRIELDDLERLTLLRDMDFSYLLYEGDENSYELEVVIKYFGIQPLELISVDAKDSDSNYHHDIKRTLKYQQSISFTLANLPTETFKHISEDLLPFEFEMIAALRRDGEPPESNDIYQSILPNLTLKYKYTSIGDVYLPRTLAILRHSSS
ncbi:MAG TPA: hypothetical protein EYG68_04890 [Leucothrix mucor]|nr:hypothetical protein [Leucothrix mucor]